jgi:hypothetical protein
MPDTRVAGEALLMRTAPAMLTVLMLRVLLPYLKGGATFAQAMDETFPLYVLVLLATGGLLRTAREVWRAAGSLVKNRLRLSTRRRMGEVRDGDSSVSSRRPSSVMADLFAGQLLILLLLLAVLAATPGHSAVPRWFLGLSGGLTCLAMVGLFRPHAGAGKR